MGELTDDFQRLLGLPDLKQFADEVLVVLERVQKTDELGARIVKLLGRAFGLRLEFLPLIGQELTLLRLEAVVLRERLELVVDVIERLGAELRDRPLSDTAPSNAETVFLRRLISARAFSTSVALSMVPALS